MKRKFLNILMLLLAMQSLQGCVLAGLGLLGGGGYYVGTKAGKREEERIKTESLINVKKELEEKDQAAKSQDQDITNQINQNYLAGALSGGIAVYPEVRNGVVILHGRVPNEATAERAIAAARKTPGVQRIISNLVILNQPAGEPMAQMPAQVPPEYQEQYQQFMQQYQQPGAAPVNGYPQIQMQQQMMSPQQMQQPQQLQQPQIQQQVPMQPQQQPGQPPRIKYEQIFNHQQPLQQQHIYAAVPAEHQDKNPQVTNKAQSKQYSQSPPGKQVSNTMPNQPASSSNTPLLLPDTSINKYSNDNDSGYKEYYPRRIGKTKAPSPVKPAAQKEVIFVPVPVPAYTDDNDTRYRGPGEYNPNPVRRGAYQNTTHPGVQQNNVPVPTPAEDNDLQYYE